MEIEATMAEDKARAEAATRAKAEEASNTPRLSVVVVRRTATQGVVKRPQTPMMRRRGI